MAGGLAVVPGDGTYIEVKGKVGDIDSKANFWRLPGVSSWTEGGGDTPTRDIVSFEGVSSQSGRARAQTIECEVTAYAPRHRAWRLVRAALIATTTLEFKLRTARQVILSAPPENVTLAVAATTGVVTVAGTAKAAFNERLQGSEFAPGMVLEIAASSGGAAESLVIEDLSGSGDTIMTVSAPKSAIAASSKFRVTIPETVRGPFAASVATADRATTRSEGDLGSGLTLQALGVLPEFSVTAGPNIS